MIAVDSLVRPPGGVIPAQRIVPRSRFDKEDGGAVRLRGVEDQLAADGFFDFFARPTVVCCEILD